MLVLFGDSMVKIIFKLHQVIINIIKYLVKLLSDLDYLKKKSNIIIRFISNISFLRFI